MKFPFYFRLGIQSHWVSAVALSLLVACGGGGGGSSGGAASSSAQIETPLTGQVVKGLTAGATVSLYRLAADGSRTAIARVTTDATGSYSIPQLLVQGNVYLVEALNGTYVNEITGVAEPLTAPLRAVFVAGAPGLPVTLSALSELVVREIELSTGFSKWSPTAVTAFNKIVEGRLGLNGLVHQKYIDLSKLTRENAVGLADADISFSNWVGVFAGFLAEVKARQPATTLSEALESFRRASLPGSSSNEELSSQLVAGLIRFYETVPVVRQSIPSPYTRLGLPSDVKSTDFAGAESTGASSEPIPNFKLRYLGYYDDDIRIGTTKTVFNSRGALIGVPPAAGIFGDSSFRHVGFASVADVYGDAEVAIGRWNRGYYFSETSGVQYKADTNEFVTTGKTLSLMRNDLPYATGVPAIDLPACGRFQMELKAQTKAFQIQGKPVTYRLDTASKLGVYVVNQTVAIGYDLVFVDSLGNKYPVSSAGGAASPSLSNTVDQNQTFKFRDPRNHDYLVLPNGEQVLLKVMLAGAGGKKALVRVSEGADDGMSAVFGVAGPLKECEKASAFTKGTVSPIPAPDYYFFSDFSQSHPRETYLTFTGNGTPVPPGITTVTNDTGVEQFGNGEVGIGIYLPPLVDTISGASTSVPSPYSYRKWGVRSDRPPFSVSTYRLVASTPLLVTVGDVLAPSPGRLTSVFLTVRQGESASSGTCELTIELDGVTSVLNTYYFFGHCEGAVFPNVHFQIDFATGGEDNYGVITLHKTYSSNVIGKAALMMERIR